MSEFLKTLSRDKIKINWNKNPVKMELFLSFLTVQVKRGTNHLGHDTGWTRLYGDNDLVIRGGVVGGVEYLDGLEYRKKLDNAYNNYVNPFYLLDILNDEGKSFFLDYYSDEIQKEINLSIQKVEIAKEKLASAEKYKLDVFNFWQLVGHKPPAA